MPLTWNYGNCGWRDRSGRSWASLDLPVFLHRSGSAAESIRLARTPRSSEPTEHEGGSLSPTIPGLFSSAERISRLSGGNVQWRLPRESARQSLRPRIFTVRSFCSVNHHCPRAMRSRTPREDEVAEKTANSIPIPILGLVPMARQPFDTRCAPASPRHEGFAITPYTGRGYSAHPILLFCVREGWVKMARGQNGTV